MKGAQNMPLNHVSTACSKLNKSKTIITCCASGMRSAQAKKVLTANGFTAVNGGGWSSLQGKI
ncbi:rhodanese-like domain-containing protein [Formosa sp. 4Alg 33]|uniref:rhodanese-like domain-containing protein n=1 Tax=Formosa sp. 4Alg 33 TaxID=3382189 RepID=UPI003D9C4EA5